MKTFRILPFCGLILSSCVNSKIAAPPPLPTATSLLVIGNSIAEHGADASIGWNGNWGMAASAENKDFAHLSSAGLNLPLKIVNGAPAEQEPTDNGQPLLQLINAVMTQRTLTVIELGENVGSGDMAAFQPIFDGLAQVASQGRAFVCLSTYWVNSAMDQLMEASCAAHGGTWIYIGDIYTDPNNPDYQGPPAFSNPSVEMHPHDWSMGQIADRVIDRTADVIQARQDRSTPIVRRVGSIRSNPHISVSGPSSVVSPKSRLTDKSVSNLNVKALQTNSLHVRKIQVSFNLAEEIIGQCCNAGLPVEQISELPETRCAVACGLPEPWRYFDVDKVAMRCPTCHKLLAVCAVSGWLEIACPRCKSLVRREFS